MGELATLSPARPGAFVLASAAICVLLLGGCEELRRTRAANQAVPTAPAAPAAAPTQTGPLLSQETPSVPGAESGLTKPEIYLGGGPPFRPQTAQGVTDVGSGDITVNFANAEIREVVNAILGNALGLTYLIDPRVQGTITLRSARPLPRTVAIGLLEDVLAMNGAALVREGEVYKESDCRSGVRPGHPSPGHRAGSDGSRLQLACVPVALRFGRRLDGDYPAVGAARPHVARGCRAEPVHPGGHVLGGG